MIAASERRGARRGGARRVAARATRARTTLFADAALGSRRVESSRRGRAAARAKATWAMAKGSLRVPRRTAQNCRRARRLRGGSRARVALRVRRLCDSTRVSPRVTDSRHRDSDDLSASGALLYLIAEPLFVPVVTSAASTLAVRRRRAPSVSASRTRRRVSMLRRRASPARRARRRPRRPSAPILAVPISSSPPRGDAISPFANFLAHRARRVSLVRGGDGDGAWRIDLTASVRAARTASRPISPTGSRNTCRRPAQRVRSVSFSRARFCTWPISRSNPCVAEAVE